MYNSAANIYKTEELLYYVIMKDHEKINVSLSLNEVNPHELKGLLQTIGGLAMVSDIKIEISSDEIERIEYNPELVSWLVDPEGILIPVITRHDLTEFAVNNQLANVPLCSRLFNSLEKDRSNHPNELGEPFKYMIKDDSGVSVIKAKELGELAKKLNDGEIFILGVSKKSKQLLNELESNLTVS